uniref:Transcription factor TFIIB cyclin-like domain-containing protein n=1 Tax=Arundo donax TaxID=35708 RepID=A0A0A9E6E3_ARUDO
MRANLQSLENRDKSTIGLQNEGNRAIIPYFYYKSIVNTHVETKYYITILICLLLGVQIALDHSFTRGRRVTHVSAACLYIACRCATIKIDSRSHSLSKVFLSIFLLLYKHGHLFSSLGFFDGASSAHVAFSVFSRAAASSTSFISVWELTKMFFII